MKNRLFKLLPLLLVLVLAFSLVLPATAEGEDEEVLTAAEEGEVLTTGAEDGEDEEVLTTAEEGEVLTAGEEDGEGAPETEAEDGEDGTKTTGEGSASETAGTTSQEEEAGESGSSSLFVRHLPRWITLFVIIALIIAAVILSRTKTKLGQKIAKFFRDYKSEIQKISWYSPKETAKATGVVLVFIIALAIAIGVLDFLFSKGIQLLAGLF